MENFKNKDYSIDNEQLARFAKAMGHPARITILNFLASMDSCYFGEIHNELPIAKATVSQHLKELKDAGLIQGEIETPKVKYCINTENWNKAQEYFETFFALKNEKVSCCNP
jgi:DNA-binding transcriptional ArsR family regulator